MNLKPNFRTLLLSALFRPSLELNHDKTVSYYRNPDRCGDLLSPEPSRPWPAARR